LAGGLGLDAPKPRRGCPRSLALGDRGDSGKIAVFLEEAETFLPRIESKSLRLYAQLLIPLPLGGRVPPPTIS